MKCESPVMNKYERVMNEYAPMSLFLHPEYEVSRIDQIIGLFCRILALLYGSFAKETCNFVDSTKKKPPHSYLLCLHPEYEL